MAVSDFLPSIWIPIAFLWFGFHTFFEEIAGSQLFRFNIYHQPRQALWPGDVQLFSPYRIIEYCLPCVRACRPIPLSIFSRLISFTFVSALLLPVLRLNLMLPLWFQGLGTGDWLGLTRRSFSAILKSAYKCSISSKWKSSDFSARTCQL